MKDRDPLNPPDYLIQMARKMNYEIAEGFAEEELTFTLSDAAAEVMQIAASTLAERAGVSIEVAQSAIMQDCLIEFLGLQIDD